MEVSASVFTRHPRKLRELRKRLGLTQMEFWVPIGVHQSVGCRYEAGRVPPRPILLLVEIAYGDAERARQRVLEIRRGENVL